MEEQEPDWVDRLVSQPAFGVTVLWFFIAVIIAAAYLGFGR